MRISDWSSDVCSSDLWPSSACCGHCDQSWRIEMFPSDDETNLFCLYRSVSANCKCGHAARPCFVKNHGLKLRFVRYTGHSGCSSFPDPYTTMVSVFEVWLGRGSDFHKALDLPMG